MPRFRLTGMVAAIVALLAAAGASHASGLSATEVWCDPQTGMAIGGYDPVAYFVDRAAKPGKPGVEAEANGAAWQFSSEANKAAFERDPDAFTPRFAGRDPQQLAEGYAALGNPHIWLVEDDELYLFATAESRASWMNASPEVRRKAEANWPAVVEATQ